MIMLILLYLQKNNQCPLNKIVKNPIPLVTDAVKREIDELEQKITHCLITGLYCLIVPRDKEFMTMSIASLFFIKKEYWYCGCFGHYGTTIIPSVLSK